MKPLVKILVRSKSDADAVRHALRRFVNNELTIDTLKGARKIDDIANQLKRHVDFKGLVIVMLGLEDREALKLKRVFPQNFVFYVISKSKVRNERPSQIARHYLQAKASYRMRLSWLSNKRTYTLFDLGDLLDNWMVNPRYDVYMPSPGMAHELERHFKISPSLIVKKLGGLHAMYRGPRLIANIAFADEGLDFKVEAIEPREKIEVSSIEEHAKLNKEVIGFLEEISLSYLSSFEADYVLVPWSGGKDSTTALILALKAFKGKVIPVFIDTGLEFKETYDYVESMAKSLGIEPLKLKAPIREAIEQGRPLPTNKDRWCTAFKMKATEDLVKEYSKTGRVLMVIGDREAESPARLRRPATIIHEHYIEATPIKLWSALHVQLYLTLNNVPTNAMYDYGFFRIGCYICPALRNWEIKLILEKPELSYIKADRLFQEFAKLRRAWID